MDGFNLDPNLLVNSLTKENRNEGLGGGNGMLWIFLLILFLGGGNGGLFGGNGNNAQNAAMGVEGQIEAALAKAQAAGASDQLVLNAINGNKEAINQLGNYLGMEVNQVENAIRGVEKGICDLGYQIGTDTASILAAVNSGNNSLSRQLADCCCNTQRAIDSVKYDMATGFCAVNTHIDHSTSFLERKMDEKIDAAQAENRAGFQGIRDYMTAEKIAALQTDLQSAQFQISQSAQTRAILEAMGKVTPVSVSCPLV